MLPGMSLPIFMRSLLPTDTWVRLLLAPALVFMAAGMDRNYQTDLWHHLARGRVIVTEGRLLDEDRFTYTVHGQPFQDVNWLTQIGLYHLEQLGGLPLLQTVNAVLLTVMMLALVGLAWHRAGSLLAAMTVGLITFLGLWQQMVLVRPQTISFLLFVVLYAVLELAGERRWLLLFAPFVVALWANIHGAFPIALVLIGCYWLAAVWDAWKEHGWRLWRDRATIALTLCLLAALLATLANPYTWHIYEYVALTSGRASGRKIDEWLPPGLDQLVGKVWVLSLVGLIVLLVLPGRRPTARETILILVFLPVACGSVRMVAWWLLILAPLAASLLADRWPRLRDVEPVEPSVGAGVVVGLLLAGMVFCLPWLEQYNPVLTKLRTTHRVEYDLEHLAQELRHHHPSGRIFTRFEWSEYLTWTLGPEYLVFMDGRIEIIPDRAWSEYTAVTRGRTDWEKILDHYEVNYLLIDQGPYHAELRLALDTARDRWKAGESAGPITLWTRKPPR